jgi:hypothetical protein
VSSADLDDLLIVVRNIVSSPGSGWTFDSDVGPGLLKALLELQERRQADPTPEGGPGRATARGLREQADR